MSYNKRTRDPQRRPHDTSTATVSREYDSSPTKNRPSALPRSTSRSSGARLEALAASRPPSIQASTKARIQHSRTPSEDVPLVFDTSPQLEASPPPLLSSSPPLYSSGTAYSGYNMESDTVFGVALPEKRYPTRTLDLPPQLIPELRALASHHYKPTLPPSSASTISSPSTRYTESPAPWSASTTTTTPISWPSSSPAFTQTTASSRSKTVPQPREPRSRLPKLPSIRHGQVSQQITPVSESKAPVKAAEKSTRRKKSLLDSSAPTPPPRTSSVKRNDRGGRSGASSIDETLSRAGFQEPESGLSTTQIVNVTKSTASSIPTIPGRTHADLQQSIRAAPARPSREGTTDLGESRPTVMNEHRAAFSNKHRQLMASAFDEPATSTTRPREADTSGIQRSPSKLGKLARLGFFSRRGAQTPVSDQEKSPKKLLRRGPAAGTGHEGYGKYAKRGRKTSSEGSARGSDSEQSIASTKRTPLIGSSRKASSTSSRQNRSSQSDLDDFASSRMKPVVLRGGSQTSEARTDVSSDYGRSRENTPAIPQLETFAAPGSEGQLSRAVTPIRSPLQDVTNSRRYSPASLNTGAPRLAMRRSQKFGHGHESFRIPDPIHTNDLVAPLHITSYDTSVSSLPPSSAAPSISAYEPQMVGAGLPRTKDKKSKKQWWNPFKRRQQPTVSEPIYRPSFDDPTMVVTVASGPKPRTMPYYAMMESESENNINEGIGDVLSEAVRSPPRDPDFRAAEGGPAGGSRARDSVLLPAAPTWSEDAAPPSPSFSYSEADDSQIDRQPRLAHVGRIPKVVNRQERQHTPSRRSFSQPFGKKVIPDDLPTQIEAAQEAYPDRPQLEIHTDVLPSRPFPDQDDISAKPASAPARTMYTEPRLIAAPVTTAGPMVSRHESDVSYSSSSDGMLSVMGPPIVPSHRERELRAQIPALRIMSGLPGDDEIWKEYDDFLDHVLSPSKSKKGRGLPPVPSLQTKTTLATGSPIIGVEPLRNVKGNLAPLNPRKATLDLTIPNFPIPPVMFPSPGLLSDRSVSEEIRLRRSRIVSALHDSMDPSSPFSMREFLQDYGPDSAALASRFSTVSTNPFPAPVTPTSTAFREEARDHTHDENAHLLDSVERAKDPARQSELHYASLEVARWLSFGRVLFSPAHDEVHAVRETNVLIVDGLGNEDWSIYCAVTYESENAVIYDLKEDSTSGLSQASRDSAHTPANHHRRAVSSFSDRFPFHSAFFSAVVLRFPPAMSEAKMRNIITECRRVLVPGGHLEIMLLELDIVNMGVQTRRAVRELKMSMTDAAPELDLKPTIDNFQSMLGGKGFTGLSRCVVGVPVTGRPAGSTDSSTSSRSSRGSGGLPRRMLGQTGRPGHPPKNNNFSLNDLVADHSDNADAKIGRMVSRTARSWWQHCYEADVMAAGPQSGSVFGDKRVMQECKSRASSFKLLIAYAQRPVFESRRRTTSESGASSTATAGSQRRNRLS